ncbi:MAG: hypothetical protein AMJ92_03490 [candidate division Zixibacteria bacterium SM23_81]|nr:MAG: hypothetical protein AMJ92_03490 [candidate division Zixibacteria bacterium SM23_81]
MVFSVLFPKLDESLDGFRHYILSPQSHPKNSPIPLEARKERLMRLRKKRHSIVLRFLYLLVAQFVLSAPLSSADEEARVVWFSRFEYDSEADIRSEIGKADSCRCNIILFQVRGQADALYLSDLEPWSELLGGGYPGFDPLAVAIEEAQLRGMELHAYINVFPVWNGANLPADPQHIYNLHPEWVMVDQSGIPMDPSAGYAFISPGIPQAAQHIRDVITDIVTKYDVDGVHLDYIRYPSSGYSYDDSSLARFQREYGGTPGELPDQWKQFRRNLVTHFVSGVYYDVTGLKPWVKVSAATWGDFYDGYTFYYQDSHGWLESKILDFSAPMIYTDDMWAFHSRLENHVVSSYGRHIYAGIGAYLLEPTELLAQVDSTRSLAAEGCTFFSSTSLGLTEVSLLRSGPFAQQADIPVMPWKELKPFTLSVARSISGTQVDVLFSQQVQIATAEDELHYSFDGGLSLTGAESAQLDSLNHALVHLTTTSQTEATVYTLTVTGVENLQGQTLTTLNASRKFVGKAHSGIEIVVDNSDPGFSTVGSWSTGAYGNPYGTDYRWTSSGTGSAAIWTLDLPNASTYSVYAYWVQGTNRATDAPYIIHYMGGADTVLMNQQLNGEQWNKLGSYPFEAGTNGDITLTNEASGGVIIADAVRLVEVFTPVPLVQFNAQEIHGLAFLSWTLPSEARAIGSNLYRSTSPNGPFQRLNDQLLPGQIHGEYMDSAVLAGNSYFYLLGVVDGNNREEVHGPVTLTLKGSLPMEEFDLAQNYPNPFNASTRIRFTVPPGTGPLPVSLKIYNILGQEIRALVDEVKRPGQHMAWWDGRDGIGQSVASGVYFCRLRAGKKQLVRKMLLVR